MTALTYLSAFALSIVCGCTVLLASRHGEDGRSCDQGEAQCPCSLTASGAISNLTIAAIAFLNELQSGPPSLLSLTRNSADAKARRYVRSGTLEPVGSFRPSRVGDSRRREDIREATREAWDAYERDAWGFDELRPLSGDGTNNFAEGLGTTIVDSLTTLYIMGGLDGRYERAREWVATQLRFDRVGRVIVFETVIRILGGLLSMYQLSGDEMYIHKAEELGARLAAAFETPHGFPWPRCFLNDTGRCEHHDTISDSLYLAEVGTIQLEFRALAHHSTHPLMRTMKDVVESIVESLQKISSSSARLREPHEVLLPFSLSHSLGEFSTNLVTLGAPADSYFEYLVKLWVQGGRVETHYWNLWARTIDAIVDVGTYKSRAGDRIVRDIIADNDGSMRFTNKMDHFSCYIPGMIILGLDGLKSSETERRKAWEDLASELTETCYNMYVRSPCGLSGEFVRLDKDDRWRMSGGYQLRPEAIEAFFYMYRHTKDEKYREWAWHVFEHIEKHCRTAGGGYAVLKNSRSRAPRQEDVMHSFLLSETFKYLYLIFGDDEGELPLSKWVFNTEAHPLLVTPDLSWSGNGCDCLCCNRDAFHQKILGDSCKDYSRDACSKEMPNNQKCKNDESAASSLNMARNKEKSSVFGGRDEL